MQEKKDFSFAYCVRFTVYSRRHFWRYYYILYIYLLSLEENEYLLDLVRIAIFYMSIHQVRSYFKATPKRKTYSRKYDENATDSCRGVYICTIKTYIYVIYITCRRYTQASQQNNTYYYLRFFFFCTVFSEPRPATARCFQMSVYSYIPLQWIIQYRPRL